MDPLLEEAFEKGRLVRPDQTQPDLVHLAQAIAKVTGVGGFERMPQVDYLADLMGGEVEHLVFILVDGLGMNIVSRLPGESFLKGHVRAVIRSISPSTTACALTAVATGEWPARHGVTGWFSFLAERNLPATPLPFHERFTGKSLVEMGLTAEEVFPVPAFQRRMERHRQLTLLPMTISQTPYARYSRGYTHGVGYNSIAHGFDELIAHVGAAKKPTYTHLYIPDVDSRCHHYGVEHPTVEPLVMEIDGQVARAAEALKEKARIVLCADHGLLDVPVANHIGVRFDDEMMGMLRTPFSGDARMPLFHVKKGRHGEFAGLFEERYGDRFTLVGMEEAEGMGLFGPYKMSEMVRGRFGDFVGIARKAATMHYLPEGAGVDKHPFVAQHAGLSREEMEIPVVVV